MNFLPDFYQGIIIVVCVNIIAVLGVSILTGFTRLFSFGNAAFMSIGAYTAALLTARLHWPFVPALLAGAALAALAAWLLGSLTLRLKGDYFLITTLGFGECVRVLFEYIQPVTGGAQGLTGIPNHTGLWTALASLALALLLAARIVYSRFGRFLEAVREEELAAGSAGIDTTGAKKFAFVVSAVFAGWAGGLWAHHICFIAPVMFNLPKSAELTITVVIGGLGSLSGSVLGALLVNLLPEIFRSLSSYRMFLYGAAVVAVIILRPDGLLGYRELTPRTLLSALARFRSRKQSKKAGEAGEPPPRSSPFGASASPPQAGIPPTGAAAPVSSPKASTPPPDGPHDTNSASGLRAALPSPAGIAPNSIGIPRAASSPSSAVDPASSPDPAPSPDSPREPSSPSAFSAPSAVASSSSVVNDSILEILSLGKDFGGVRAIDGFSLILERGAIHGLIGPNGAGKTTIFNTITGIYAPNQGSVRFLGRDITGAAPHAVARAGIGRTFQNIRLFGNMGALQNVVMAGSAAQRYGLPEALLRLPRCRREERELRERAALLLEAVGLSGQENARAGSLPYGHQRRLEIARALALGPSLLLLDEPAAGMNAAESRELAGFIRAVRERFGLTILMIEHHMDVVTELCDRVTVLNFGRTVTEGSAAKVKRDPRVIEAYLGSTDG